MDRIEIKKMLVDLELPVAELARRVGLSRNTVNRYLAGKLRRPATREQIQAVVDRQGRAVARKRGRTVGVPKLWDARPPQAKEG